MAPKNHHFGAGSFKNELWIKQKEIFKKPIGVDVEFITPGAFDWLLADESGALVRTLRESNAGGKWCSMDFASLGLYDNYSIGFRNVSGGEKRIKQGDVRYDG